MLTAAHPPASSAPLLHRLLDSPSWIVSRSTYRLVDELGDEPITDLKQFKSH